MSVDRQAILERMGISLWELRPQQVAVAGEVPVPGYPVVCSGDVVDGWAWLLPELPRGAGMRLLTDIRRAVTSREHGLSLIPESDGEDIGASLRALGVFRLVALVDTAEKTVLERLFENSEIDLICAPPLADLLDSADAKRELWRKLRKRLAS